MLNARIATCASDLRVDPMANSVISKRSKKCSLSLSASYVWKKSCKYAHNKNIDFSNFIQKEQIVWKRTDKLPMPLCFVCFYRNVPYALDWIMSVPFIQLMYRCCKNYFREFRHPNLVFFRFRTFSFSIFFFVLFSSVVLSHGICMHFSRTIPDMGISHIDPFIPDSIRVSHVYVRFSVKE